MPQLPGPYVWATGAPLVDVEHVEDVDLESGVATDSITQFAGPEAHKPLILNWRDPPLGLVSLLWVQSRQDSGYSIPGRESPKDSSYSILGPGVATDSLTRLLLCQKAKLCLQPSTCQ